MAGRRRTERTRTGRPGHGLSEPPDPGLEEAHGPRGRARRPDVASPAPALLEKRMNFELPAALRVAGETPAGLHDAAHVPGFLPDGDADALLAHCLGRLDWREERLTMFGRVVTAPRLTACYGDPGRSYRYSGVSHPSVPWTPALRRTARTVGDRLGVSFNFVVANRYRSGADCIGWHADDERGLGPVIASISLGATRTFRIRPKDGGGPAFGLALAHGDLVVMWGRFQRDYKHALPRAAGVVEERVNLTLRRIEA